MHFLFQKYDHVASTVLQLELIKLKVNTITCRLVFFYMINFNEKCSTLWVYRNLFLSTPLCEHLFLLFSSTEHSYW